MLGFIAKIAKTLLQIANFGKRLPTSCPNKENT
jgi:hypothetical protein